MSSSNSFSPHLLHNVLCNLDGEFAHARTAELLHNPISSTGYALLGLVWSSVGDSAADYAIDEVGGVYGRSLPPY